MSNITDPDEPIDYGKAARWVRRLGGIPVASSTIARWVNVGLYGVRLSASRIGGRWYVTPRKLVAFIRAVCRVKGVPAPRELPPWADSPPSPNADAVTPAESRR